MIISFQAVILSIIAFLASAAFASPLFFFTKLEVVFLDAAYCYEVCWLCSKERVLHCSHKIFQSWNLPHSRLAYVISGLVIQYLIPFIIVTMAYIMVARAFHISTEKMKTVSLKSGMIRKLTRRKRTDILLTVISILFFL